jgi:hypothetical protein
MKQRFAKNKIQKKPKSAKKKTFFLPLKKLFSYGTGPKILSGIPISAVACSLFDLKAGVENFAKRWFC